MPSPRRPRFLSVWRGVRVVASRLESLLEEQSSSWFRLELLVLSRRSVVVRPSVHPSVRAAVGSTAQHEKAGWLTQSGAPLPPPTIDTFNPAFLGFSLSGHHFRGLLGAVWSDPFGSASCPPPPPAGAKPEASHAKPALTGRSSQSLPRQALCFAAHVLAPGGIHFRRLPSALFRGGIVSATHLSVERRR